MVFLRPPDLRCLGCQDNLSQGLEAVERDIWVLSEKDYETRKMLKMNVSQIIIGQFLYSSRVA